MIDINRRNVLSAAGAGLAVAACSPKTDSAARQDMDVGDECKARAPYPQHGADPHEKVGTKFPNNTKFSPKYLCAVYIRFEASGQMIVRHGYFDLATITTDMSQERIAAKLLKSAADAKSTEDWKSVQYGDIRKEVNFENFSFGHPARLFLLIDNDYVKFDDRKDADEVYRNLLRFTQFRVDTGQEKRDGKFELVKANENYAFFDATLIEMEEFPNRKLLRLDNHYTDKNGKPIKAVPTNPVTHHRYSINFNLLWTTGDPSGKPPSVKVIPMVIDPDGGNMGSQP